MNLTKFLTVFTTAMVFAGAPSIGLSASPTIETVTFDRIYVPVGFDSNDNIEFVGEGRFENGCYRPLAPKTEIDLANKIITVGPLAYKYPGLCVQVILPFSRVVEVGVLPAGEYRILQKGTGRELGKLGVTEARRVEPDNFLYAPVSQAFFDQNQAQAEIRLKGNLPVPCMKFEEIKTTITNNVIVVQPIVRFADPGECSTDPLTYSKIIPVGDISAGRYLLHIRSMNGASVNTLVDVE